MFFRGGGTFSLSDKVADKTSRIVADSSAPATSKLVDAVLAETEPKDPALDTVTEEAIIAEFEAGIIIGFEEEPVQSPEWTQVYSNLEKFREKFGGQEPINKKFFDVQWEVCQANVRNALEHEWGPKLFWEICAKFFDVNLKENPLYAHIKTTINAVNWFDGNKEKLEELCKEDPLKAVRMFEKATGQLWHPNLNDPKGFFPILDETSTTIKTLFGINHLNLEDFTDAFDASNCCFPARQRQLSEFMIFKTAQENSEWKITNLTFENPSDKRETINKIVTTIVNDLLYAGFNANFTNVPLKEKINTVWETLRQEISEHRTMGGKSENDIAESLEKITQADVGEYLFAIYSYEKMEHLEEEGFFDEGFTKEGNTVIFPDGSSYTFEE